MKSILILVLAQFAASAVSQEANEQNTTEPVVEKDDKDVKVAFRYVLPHEQPQEHPQMISPSQPDSGQNLQRCRECLGTIESFQALSCKSVCSIQDLEQLVMAVSQQQQQPQNPQTNNQFVQTHYVEQNSYKPVQPALIYPNNIANPGFGTVNSAYSSQQSSNVLPPIAQPSQYYYPIAQLPNPVDAHKSLVSVIVNGYLDLVNLFDRIKVEHFRLMCSSCLHLMLGVKAINGIAIQCPASCSQGGMRTIETHKKFMMQGTNSGQGVQTMTVTKSQINK